MKGYLAAALTICLFLTITTNSGFANPLAEFKWKNRIIVISLAESSHSKTESKALEKAFQKEAEKIADRDLVLLDCSPSLARIEGTQRLSGDACKALRRQLSLSDGKTVFVLIGKDSGVKARQQGTLQLDKFFALIDTMPMRKAEMRRGK